MTCLPVSGRALGPLECALALRVAQLRIGASRQEELQDAEVAVACREHQRGRAALVGDV